MDLKGEEIIAQPMQRVWDCLNDPEILKACLPGCEEITKTGDDEFKVVLTAAVGPVKARFTGKLMLSARVLFVELRRGWRRGGVCQGSG